MRLVTIRTAGPAANVYRLGILLDDRVLPVSALAEIAPSQLPDEIDRYDLPTLLAHDSTLGALRDALEVASRDAIRDASVPLDQVRLGPAVPRPGKVICVGHNFMDHIREQGIEVPDRPALFAKFANAVIGPGDSIVKPAGTHALDLEAELAVVIGRSAKRVAAERAFDYVAGYTAANDVTARDWQGQKVALRQGERGDGQWLRAKSSDTFLPLGPALVMADEVAEPSRLAVRSWRIPATGDDAGKPFQMQNGTTADMIYGIAQLIEFMTNVITLDPGDVLLTGTPNGVGAFRQPPMWLEPGDIVRVEVEGIGSIENPVTDEDGNAPEGSPAADVLAASSGFGVTR